MITHCCAHLIDNSLSTNFIKLSTKQFQILIIFRFCAISCPPPPLSLSLFYSLSSLFTFHLIILHPSFFSLFFRSSFLLHLHSVSKQTWTSWHVLAIISVYKINNNKLIQRDDILNQLKPRWTIISHFVINHSIFVPWLLRFCLVVVFSLIFWSVVSFVSTRKFIWLIIPNRTQFQIKYRHRPTLT